MKTQTKTKEEIMSDIAKKHFHVETLETRRSAMLDFRTVHVCDMREALKEAFEAGVNSQNNKVEVVP